MDSAGKNIGKGIAIAGIWIGLGIISFSPVASSSILTITAVAVVATACVAVYF